MMNLDPFWAFLAVLAYVAMEILLTPLPGGDD